MADQPTRPHSQFPHTLAEVTVMDVDRLRSMCIEQEDIAGTREMAQQKDKFRVRLLSSDNEKREGTSLLIEKMYSWRGYHTKKQIDEVPNRITLVAEFDGHIYGTITVNLDSDTGLSADETYPDVMAALRGDGRRVCEFGKFAVEQSVKSKRLMGTLFHLMCIYAFRLQHCDDVLIEVNPRHRVFYEKYLSFVPAAEERMCSRVGAPAVLLRLTRETYRSRVDELGGRWRDLKEEKSMYKYFFPRQEEDAIAGRLGR
ncbi:long-chain N-acyl amino acid synthase [Methyloversatilis sp. XJ19-49]|uniref:N-acyl amino acid synthase FeeM domain-containing protein n=1 Tax=Methyloversatilis sp. XJ19-49 TaxID=2963429 RepID=UPI00211BE85A|nr:long-chain N-acyl amino acid synthase [Methyloversatilis sp. XJ19-49]MCQ9378086.1 long-chain N-acyl amino acid synthase [Methyloversatilis sp. XJ19-49]